VYERTLRYWREDPLLSEHHEHWHLVYPFVGRIDEDLHTEEELAAVGRGEREGRFFIWNKRHGELFAYMHSQLLARYEAERLAVQLPAVIPLNDYRAFIPEGYSPGIELKLNNVLVKVGDRPDNVQLTDLQNSTFCGRPGAKIEAQERFRDRFLAALESSSANNFPSSLSELAEHVEPTDRGATQYFGALHNDGHLLISMHDDNPKNPGCMFWESAAVRDPVFFRWHAHVDELFRKFQDTLPPYAFSDLPPLEIEDFFVSGTSGQRNTLSTEMRTRSLRPQTATKIEYLSHEDFTYEFTVHNKSGVTIPVTVRIFVAPEQRIPNRNSWIEMDKFQHSLAADKSTIRRYSRNSSVVRHPVWTADMLEGKEDGPNESGTSPGCRCGWPYTLLLPRGTGDGIPYRFVALLTRGEDLSSNLLATDNSSSYCGLVDTEYPDKQAMGFPFDRPFAGSLRGWVAGGAKPPQLASAVVKIKHFDRT
jgi:tyrosinase